MRSPDIQVQSRQETQDDGVYPTRESIVTKYIGRRLCTLCTLLCIALSLYALRGGPS
jgi:hypothetical protein